MLDLTPEVVCRDQQLAELRSFLAAGIEQQIPVQSLFVFGGSGTGKSFCVRHVLETSGNTRFLWLNSLEILQPRCAFSSILNQLKFSENHFKSLDDFSELVSCDSASDFVRLFSNCLQPTEKLYIVFDNAHRLREMDLMPFFLRLQELSNRRVCCIFISTILFNHLLTNSDFFCPNEVNFPQYSQEQLCQVLVANRPTGYSKDFYRSFINLVMSMFKNVTNNVKELMHIATTNFSHYIIPVKEDPTAEFDSLRLWRNIEPHLKKAMSTIYLRDSDARLETAEDGKTATVKQIIELPFYSKFLLIAAYLASYNPAATDKKFFVKKSNRERRKNNGHRKEKPNYHLLGPRPFPINRLLAIFHAIIDGPVQPTTVLLSQVSSLVYHRLVTQAASKDLLNTPRYKCCVDFDYITTIAKTVKFPVVEYLEDFCM